MKTTNSMGFHKVDERMGSAMKWQWFAALLISAASISTAGCAVAADEVNRVQTNLVDKSMFEGEWWYGTSVIDAQGDSADIFSAGMAPFSGDMGWTDVGLNSGGGVMPRIRWVIDQNFLYAFRAYELVDGGNDNGRAEDFRGQPLAAFKIEAHVDVRQEYNAVTGEPTNVTVENTTDRRWYERQFMRVDWSQNLITSFYVGSLQEDALYHMAELESVPFQFEDGAHPEFPASYEPQFVRVSQDPDYRFAAEWPAADADKVHFMSFVSQQIWSPGSSCFTYGTRCSSAAVTVRSSFMRIPPNHEYATESQTYSEFDRFGLFRSEQRTYVRGGNDREVTQQFCASDDDCGRTCLNPDGSGEHIGCPGSCDPDQHICVGGLSRDYGETDFLTFYRPRYNFYSDSLTDTQCRSDWQCDGRYDDIPGTPGSICDRAARRCTVPPAERPLRPVVYHLNAGFPAQLVRSAFQVVGTWNEVFMRGRRAQLGLAQEGGAPVACQNVDPTQYCWCGSPEDNGGTCNYQFDPFAPNADGVTNPYDCRIVGPAEIAHPTEYSEYGNDVYGYHFEGAECMLKLVANSCDIDSTKACEGLGDIRYQFINYVQHGHVQWGGVAMPLMDPRTGELITSNANLAAESMESVATTAVQLFPVLRNEASSDAYFNAENVRTYFSDLGRTEHPAALSTAGGAGVIPGDPSRPGLPVDLSGFFRANMDRVQANVSHLHGAEGRAMIFSDRQRQLAGTSIENRFLQSAGRDLFNANVGESRLSSAGTRATDDEVADQISPFRGHGLDVGIESQRRRAELASQFNMDPAFAPEIRSAYWQYWANQFAETNPTFAGRDLTSRNHEAGVRMQQSFVRSYLLHELGHSIGLRHNFGGSFDRDQYMNGYYNVARRLPLPLVDAFDTPGKGGNGDGFLNGQEIDRWNDELRSVRNQRSDAGVGNTQASSIMEYPGDLSDLSGLGHYDIGAVTWSYFNQVEAFTANPTLSAPNSSLDGIEQSDITPRAFMDYYRGGDSCQEDTDCPGADVPDQPMHQRCIRNPRFAPVPERCRADEDACVCSNFDEDFKDYVSGNDFRNPGDPINFYPVKYLFCSDERTTDISWCSRFDAGESFQEAVDNWRRQWEFQYPFNYYRRYQRAGAQPGHIVQPMMDAVKVYQHLFFRYFNEPEFRSQVGSLGFNDQYQASIDVMNWLAEIASLPDVGSYELDTTANIYRQVSDLPGQAGADVSLTPGVGFNTWSAYETGQNGFFRTARAGVFVDKLYALWGLARRDWNLSYSYDERYYINFYDLFPVEMTELFGGYIQNNVRSFGPRVTVDSGGARVQHMNVFRQAGCGPSGNEPCRGTIEETYTGPALDGSSNEILRDWATIQALSQFAVFYDTSFEQQLSIYRLGNGDGHTIPTAHADGTPTCAYLDAGCSDPDYVVYNSERYHLTYVANVVRPRFEFNLPEEAVGFSVLKRLVDKQTRINVLEALGSPTAAESAELTRLSGELQEDESFLEYLIDVQHRFGISSYL